MCFPGLSEAPVSSNLPRRGAQGNLRRKTNDRFELVLVALIGQANQMQGPMSEMRHQRRFEHHAAHFRISPDSGHIAASHRSATKSADARRGAAVGGELRQAAGAVASVTTYKRGVTRSQPHISRFKGEAQRGLFCGTGRFGQGEQRLHC